jgi:hypothetical protein
MKYLDKQEFVAIICALAGLIVVVVGILLGWWELSAVFDHILDLILVSMLGVLLWGFRKRIARAFKQLFQQTNMSLQAQLPIQHPMSLKSWERPMVLMMVFRSITAVIVFRLTFS